MRDILKTEEHVAVPPSLMEDPFYRMTYVIKEEIRKFKWTEAERGNPISWDTACAKWFKRNEMELENFHRQIVRFHHPTPHKAVTC